jgi:hypothetical protein
MQGNPTEWTSQLSMPRGMLGVSETAVKAFVTTWKSVVGDWTDLGNVQTSAGPEDLISDDLETWIYDHMVMCVVTIAGEMASGIKATMFAGEMDVMVDGTFDVSGTSPINQGMANSIFNGSNDIMDWVDDLMSKEDWFVNSNISGGQLSMYQSLLPQDVVSNMTRQALGMGVAFLESALQTAEARVVGRWFKNALSMPGASRRLQEMVANATSIVSLDAKEYPGAQSSLETTHLRPHNDTYVKEFVTNWFNKYGTFAGAVGGATFGMLGGVKVDLFNEDWEKNLFQNLVSMMMLACHDALSMGVEFPFVFEEKIRLQRVPLEEQVPASDASSSRRLQAQENPTDGYGSTTQYKNQQADISSLRTFIHDFKSASSDIYSAGNVGLVNWCDTFGVMDDNDANRCSAGDVIDDDVMLERFANMSISFFANAISNSEARMFGQRFYLALKNPDLKRFTAYLEKNNSKMPVESVKAWIEARFESQYLGAQKAAVEKAFSIDVATKVHQLVNVEELTKFAVKSVLLTLQFIEMSLMDAQLDILGIPYELAMVLTGEHNRVQLLEQSARTPVNVDWSFVSTFVNDWYTTNNYGKHPATGVELTSFFNMDIGFITEVEKLLCSLSLGAAMDIVNYNFQSLDLPLPLIKDAVKMVDNHPAPSSRRLATEVVVPDTKFHHSSCLKGGKLIETYFTDLNTALPPALQSKDPVALIHSDPTAVDKRMESINAKTTCGFVLKNLRGLGAQRFNNLTVDADFPCGLSGVMNSACKVCTKGSACGDDCVTGGPACTSAPGCAVDSTAMHADIEITGRFARNGDIGMFCRECTVGKACGDSCIEESKTCSKQPGCAADTEEVVCKICGGGRKACGDECVPAGQQCSATAGCARTATDLNDIDLIALSKSQGRIAFDVNEVSLDAEVTCKADFCGVPVPEGECCPGEELFEGKCYVSCTNATNGKYPNRTAACTCQIGTQCAPGEEPYAGKCYKTCASLTDNTHPIRDGANTCKMTTICKSNEELWDGLCYKKCSILKGPGYHRSGTHTCQKDNMCEDDEEDFQGKCYKKCSLLSGGSHPVRHGPNSCKKVDECADNEEKFSNKCFKKCSLLTGGDATHRTGPKLARRHQTRFGNA